jgi:pyruvate/2-oxoglutarate dehydrogenase complex dihydrolipoamide acyltransferase (E2) component
MRLVTAPVPPEEAAPEPEKGHRSPWIWVCAGLGVVAIGALIWAFTTKSDLNDTQSELDSTQQQLASTQAKLDATPTATATPEETPTPTATETATPEDDDGNALLTAGALAAAKSLYNDLKNQLGATQEDLAQTQQDLEKANQQAQQAEKDAAAAKDKADQAGNETDKAQAEAEQARADQKAAESKLKVATGCAKAYISAFGALFEGDDLKAQAAKVSEQFKQIHADCQSAFKAT